MKQSAQLILLAQALVGAQVIVTDRRGDSSLVSGHSATLNLKPGDTFTVAVVSDERWLEAQRAEADRLASPIGYSSTLPDPSADADAARLAEIQKLHEEQTVDRATTSTTARRHKPKGGHAAGDQG